MAYDCIVAIATSTAGKAGVNIIRLSGDNALNIAFEVFESKSVNITNIQPNMMNLGKIKAKNFSEQAFCVYYKMPKSYTGEDVVEFHCHGGIGIANAVFRLLTEKGARPAEAGEFTKRAFLNGKISLAQAEGINDMINAESEAQLMQAYRQLSGEVSKTFYRIEEKLLSVAAALEVNLDYPDEAEGEYLESLLNEIIEELSEFVTNSENASVVNEGVNIAIAGLPNAGKSSLLNALVMADRAIVTEIAGTTRDVLKETIELDGIRLNLFDTAGIREDADGIEKMGIQRAYEAAYGADIVLFVADLSVPESGEERRLKEAFSGKRVITVGNKKDITKYPREGAIPVKALPPADIEELKKEISGAIGRERIFSQAVVTNRRQLFCLKNALSHIVAAKEATVPDEYRLSDIRSALEELAKVTGKDVSDSIVDEVFSTFCVGK